MLNDSIVFWLQGKITWDLLKKNIKLKELSEYIIEKKEKLSINDIERYDIDRCAWEFINKVNRQNIVECPITYDHCYVMSTTETGFKILRHRWAYDWYRACTSSEKTAEFYFRTKVVDGEPLDREQCLKDLIIDNGRLSILFRDPLTGKFDDKGEQRLHSLVTWFTRRYDLNFARWLIQQLRSAKYEKATFTTDSPLGGEAAKSRDRFHWPYVLSLALFLFLLFPTVHPLRPCCLYPHLLLLIYSILLGGVVWLTFSSLAHLMIRLLVPRLAGCIIVGYLPLVVGIETWQAMSFLAQSAYFWQTLFLMLLAGVGAFGYLMLEMKNTIPQNKRENKRILIERGLAIYSLGLAWSLVIGLIIMDLLAAAFKKMDENKFLSDSQITWLPGVVGEIPWEILLGYVPLALLIGIFVQIIWEEKPITEPL